MTCMSDEKVRPDISPIVNAQLEQHLGRLIIENVGLKVQVSMLESLLSEAKRRAASPPPEKKE